jgi:soluble P-type ATPase
MIRVEIPGTEFLELEHFVTDFSGTLSEDGIMLLGVKEKLEELSKKIKIHVLTSDTFGRAKKELEGVNCTLHVLEGEGHTIQKEKYVINLGPDKVVAFGNGNNDVLMLRAARLGIAVCLKEGCSSKAIEASQILVKSPIDAIDLLLSPKRLIATLRV